jgi:hypothetical protein
MRPFVRASLVALLALLVPALAAAQGLGDAAAREKQKRQATPAKAKAKVLTNDDLKKEEDDKTKTDGASGSATGASPTLEPAAASGGGQADRERQRGTDAGEGGDSRQAAVQQAQARVDSARQAVVEAEARVKELGDKLNPMSPSFVYAQPNAANAAGEEARTREELRNAEAQLDGARQALVAANRDLEDVRQGRRPASQR